MENHISRRQFLKKTGYAGLAMGASTFLPWRFAVRDAYAYSSSPTLAKFVEALRDVGGIPVAASDGLPGLGGAVHYSLTLEEFTDQLHPGLPVTGTRLWGYRPSNVVSGSNKHLGGIIVAKPRNPGPDHRDQ